MTRVMMTDLYFDIIDLCFLPIGYTGQTPYFLKSDNLSKVAIYLKGVADLVALVGN